MELQPMEFKNQRIMTTRVLAEVYGTDDTNIKTNFNNNKSRFIEGKHYFQLSGEELKEFKRVVNNINDPSMKFASVLTLWTERGAARHAKILDTDVAWEIYEQLEETYFRVRDFKRIDSYMIADPIERAKAWIAEEEERQGLILLNKQKDQLIGELKPKADYMDSILKNKGLVTITQIAKDYGMSGTKMNELLHELKIQYKQSGQWLLYEKYQAKGYTHSSTVDILRSDGRPDVKMNTKWTQKGRLFLYDLLKEVGVYPVVEKVREVS